MLGSARPGMWRRLLAAVASCQLGFAAAAPLVDSLLHSRGSHEWVGVAVDARHDLDACPICAASRGPRFSATESVQAPRWPEQPVAAAPPAEPALVQALVPVVSGARPPPSSLV